MVSIDLIQVNTLANVILGVYIVSAVNKNYAQN